MPRKHQITREALGGLGVLGAGHLLACAIAPAASSGIGAGVAAIAAAAGAIVSIALREHGQTDRATAPQPPRQP